MKKLIYNKEGTSEYIKEQESLFRLIKHKIPLERRNIVAFEEAKRQLKQVWECEYVGSILISRGFIRKHYYTCAIFRDLFTHYVGYIEFRMFKGYMPKFYT